MFSGLCEFFSCQRIQRTKSSGLFVHIGGFQFWIKDARWLRIFYSEQEGPPGVTRMLEKVPVGRLLSGTDSRFCSPAASGFTPSPSLWPSPFEMNPCLSHIASWLGSNQAINTKEEFYWPIPSLLFYCLAFPLPSLEIDKSIFYKTCIQFSRLRFALSVKASYVAALFPSVPCGVVFWYPPPTPRRVLVTLKQEVSATVWLLPLLTWGMPRST